MFDSALPAPLRSTLLSSVTPFPHSNRELCRETDGAVHSILLSFTREMVAPLDETDVCRRV